jgi:LacI family transcriptional regulator
MTDGRYPLAENERYLGYRRALEEAGIAPDETLIAPTRWVDYENGYLCTKDVFSRVRDVDGIFAAADRYLPGVFTALRELGKTSPRDVQVSGFDDIRSANGRRDAPPCADIRRLRKPRWNAC